MFRLAIEFHQTYYVAALLALTISWSNAVWSQPQSRAYGLNDTAAPTLEELLPEERVSIAVYEKCNRSVVHIATKSIQVSSFSQLKLREGSGSGSVLNQQGIILTNFHVIEGAKKISVSLHNGLFYDANLIGQDPDSDIALLKIDAPAEFLQPVALGNSDSLRVGQRIYAIGNPFGLERTMSTGMISSLDRQIPSQTGRSMRSLIQLDATLNQGNSGGPLLNTRGELIGMNTAIISSDGDSAGVGFAIPSSTIERIVGQLLRHGKVIRASIGIARVYESDQGLLVVSTVPGGPADRAGIKGFQLIKQVGRRGNLQFEQTYYDLASADLILAINGQPVAGADQLLAIIEAFRPGDIVQVTTSRDGKQQTVSVQLSEN